jgi:hypothetical protein
MMVGNILRCITQCISILGIVDVKTYQNIVTSKKIC